MIKLSPMRLSPGTFVFPVKLLRRWHVSLEPWVAILPTLTKSLPEGSNVEENKSKRWSGKSSLDDILGKPADGQIFTEASSNPILSNYMSQYISALSQFDWGFCYLQLKESLLVYAVC